jgi:hypothetical protein
MADPTTDTTQTSRPSIVPANVRAWFAKLPAMVRDWLTEPDFSIYFVVFMLAAAAFFLRQPSGVGGGFVFDEQEAILANPYVRGHQPWFDAFKRDFWGLLPDRSIGSYRPIPNFLWRALWRLQEWRSKGTGSAINTPFVWFNIVFHATNAALLATIVRGVLKRVGVAWLVGGIFCVCAILVEAVSGIVGIADVLGGLSILLAIAALSLTPALVGPAVFAATLFGMLSKESAVVNVGLVPLAALIFGRAFARDQNQRWWLNAVTSFIGASLALGVYFWIRHKYFHIDYTPDPEKLNAGLVSKLSEKARVFIGAPNLPVDPFNNPLADPNATWGQRVGGALRVYLRGLGQILVPNRLSPDYSMPQEPLPKGLIFPESVLGAIFLAGPPLVGLWLVREAHRATRTELFMEKGDDYRETERVAKREVSAFDAERGLLGYALIAWPAAFFPISNIPKALPTVRAERFWYTPALATSIAIAILLLYLAKKRWTIAAVLGTVFLFFQSVQTRRHANDFRDDLHFWKSAAEAVPNSAKAHLNYSVMLGARAPEIWKWTTTQAQEARLIENIRATELAPKWDMAFIYVGDTLCQLNRMDEAWEWYKKGFRIGSNNSGLVALALQCMSDHQALLGKEKDALALLDEPGMPGTWVNYLVRDTLEREKKCRGVDAPSDTSNEQVDLFGDDEPSASASASASVSASGSESAHASASASMSASASASAEPAPPPPARPPCGVDPKYRPRGLDGDPKGE